jgi:hypothetical protein
MQMKILCARGAAYMANATDAQMAACKACTPSLTSRIANKEILPPKNIKKRKILAVESPQSSSNEIIATLAIVEPELEASVGIGTALGSLLRGRAPLTAAEGRGDARTPRFYVRPQTVSRVGGACDALQRSCANRACSNPAENAACTKHPGRRK